jgi:hypothetical protein
MSKSLGTDICTLRLQRALRYWALCEIHRPYRFDPEAESSADKLFRQIDGFGDRRARLALMLSILQLSDRLPLMSVAS